MSGGGEGLVSDDVSGMEEEQVKGVLLFAKAGNWENELAGGWVRIEERMATGSLYRARRKDIPLPAMVDAG